MEEKESLFMRIGICVSAAPTQVQELLDSNNPMEVVKQLVKENGYELADSYIPWTSFDDYCERANCKLHTDELDDITIY